MIEKTCLSAIAGFFRISEVCTIFLFLSPWEMNLVSFPINNGSGEFRTFIIIMVVGIYNVDFIMISNVITMITVPITTIIIAMLVILVFIIVVITLRTINFIKIYFSIYSIIFFNIFPYQVWTKRFNDRGAL